MKLIAFIVIVLLGGKVTAEYKKLSDTAGLSLRENALAKRCSGTCAECFGAGNVPCGTGLDCYNPGAGESCCSGGNYCPAGERCEEIEGGCCLSGQNLQDCAASLGVSVPTPSTTAPVTSSTTVRVTSSTTARVTSSKTATVSASTATDGSSSSNSGVDEKGSFALEALMLGVAGLAAIL